MRPPRATLVSEDALAEAPARSGHADDLLLEDERARRGALVREALAALLKELPDEDAVLLRLRFDGGLTVPRISALLGREPRAVYGRIERLLARLRRALEGQGLEAAEIHDLVERGGLDQERSLAGEGR